MTVLNLVLGGTSYTSPVNNVRGDIFRGDTVHHDRDRTGRRRDVPSRLLKYGTDVRMRILISTAVSVKTDSKCKKTVCSHDTALNIGVLMIKKSMTLFK